MSPERWQRLSELFDRVVDLPTGQRGSFLATRCTDEPSLQAQMEALLAADGEAEGFLEKHLISTTGDEPRQTPAPRARDRIGPYKIQRVIGRGGMAEVYLASRADDAFERSVAIKLIRHGMTSSEAHRRLRVERQILARLDHPSIAVLYDGGATSDRRPYFVMEYVDGVAIDAHCDQQKLTLDERLALFLNVCDAVQSAHRNLVVHRDLKPSNILVTAGGVPKLLDFGIAKLLDPEIAGSQAETTQAWMRILTPGYASPEQVQGRPVTTASDVYSLGVLLYKMLTGHLPLRFDGQSLRQIERTIAETEPPTASQTVRRESGSDAVSALCRACRLPAEQLAGELSGDLDSILRKALRIDAHQRYGTVEQLAEDLLRYRAGLPVRPLEGDVGYRVGKFLRRNRLPVGIAALTLAAILGALSAISMLAIDLRREIATNREITDLLTSLVDLTNPDVNPGEIADLRNAFELWEGARGASLTPKVEAELRAVVARSYLAQGMTDDAFEQARRALEIQSAASDPDSLEAALIRSLVGKILWISGENESAEREGWRAVRAVRATAGNEAPELVEVLEHLVTILCTSKNYEDADLLSLEAVDLARRHFADERPEKAHALGNRGTVLKGLKRPREARVFYQETLEILEREAVPDHPRIADLLSNLASIDREQDRPRAAEQQYRQVLEIQKRVYGERHWRVAQTHYNLAAVLYDQTRLEEGLASDCAAADLLRVTLGKDHSYTVKTENRLMERFSEMTKPVQQQDEVRRSVSTICAR